MVLSLALALALPKGTVSLHVTDAHGKPIPNHEVWLEPATSPINVQPYGYHWWIPRDLPILKGKTNAAGDVTIGGVKRGEAMAVITRFGPRFDKFVGIEDPARSMDVLKFKGAVYAGKPAHIVLADDYELTGQVTEFETGAPIPGVTITLSDTSIGHMSGYPHTSIDETKTDANGTYTFHRLPNCIYTIGASPAGASIGVESRVENQKWKFESLSGDNGQVNRSASTSITLTKPRSICDFRVSKAATLAILIKKGSAKTMRGWTIWLERNREGSRETQSGQSLDWVASDAKPSPPKTEETVENHVLAGTYTILFERNSNSAKFKAQTITVRPGEHRRLEFTLSIVAALKQRR